MTYKRAVAILKALNLREAELLACTKLLEALVKAKAFK